MSQDALKQRIAAPGPRKILSLDGGGIRGMMTVEVLAGIERVLRQKLNNDRLVLADWFDFFAGTSTGAIIATCLSLGMSVDEIRRFYLESGQEMFDKAFLLRRFRYKYEDEKLAGKLRDVFGADTTLGSDKLRTLLMMVMRNASTDSPWPLSNNPFARYNRLDRDDCNLDLPLWQLVRASTAAPVYFPPEVIDVGHHEFVFVDGGITTYNNPSFQAFLMATVEPYRLNWPVGEERLLVVSVGTGTSPEANADLNPDEMNLIYNAGSIPSALMFAALNEQDFLCRVFGRCLAGDPLDREVGDMIGAKGPVEPKLFTYLRYNAELTREGLDLLGLHDIEPADVQKLDSTEHIRELQRVGQAVAEKKVLPEHFDGFVSSTVRRSSSLPPRGAGVGATTRHRGQRAKPPLHEEPAESAPPPPPAPAPAPEADAPPPASAEPSPGGAGPEPVQLGASAPRQAKPGSEFTARFVAYEKSREKEVSDLLARLAPAAATVLGIQECRWQRDTRVTVRLSARGLTVDPAEQVFTWQGGRSLLEFDVTVPAEVPEGTVPLKFDVVIEGIIVSRLRLELELTGNPKGTGRATATVDPARTAFASYSSRDRLRVLDRVAAVQIAAGIDVFLDCLDLNPGEEWKPRLDDEIRRRDLFLLFWSQYARESPWVGWELETALKEKGEHALQLHPLDPSVKPPPGLERFHAGDVVMWVRAGYEATRPPSTGS